MVEHPDTPEDLYPFAQALVISLVKKKQLRWDEHRVEDAIQDLFLAGWQVWRDTENVGLAKNRMVSRQNNLLRDFAAERRHEPKTNRLSPPEETDRAPLWDEESARGWQRPSRRFRDAEDPAEKVEVQDYIEHLPARQRQIVKFRMAGLTDREIAEEMGIGLRTVERELASFRKEYERHGE